MNSSCFILFCLVLSCFVLFYFDLFCLILFLFCLLCSNLTFFHLNSFILRLIFYLTVNYFLYFVLLHIAFLNFNIRAISLELGGKSPLIIFEVNYNIILLFWLLIMFTRRVAASVIYCNRNIIYFQDLWFSKNILTIS